MMMRQSQYLVAIERTFQVVLEVGKPVRGAHHRRSLADNRVCESNAVRGRAILDFLVHRSAGELTHCILVASRRPAGNPIIEVEGWPALRRFGADWAPRQVPSVGLIRSQRRHGRAAGGRW